MPDLLAPTKFYYHAFSVPRNNAERVLDLVRRDQARDTVYAMSAGSLFRGRYNCLTWAIAKLRDSGINATRVRGIPLPSTVLTKQEHIKPALLCDADLSKSSCTVQ